MTTRRHIGQAASPLSGLVGTAQDIAVSREGAEGPTAFARPGS